MSETDAMQPSIQGPIEVPVHNLTGVFSLRHPMEDIVPARYLRKAEATDVVHRVPWIFRHCAETEDVRGVDLNAWSKVDLHFKAVFVNLHSAPEFPAGMYDNSFNVEDESRGDRYDVSAQSRALYVLLHEILNSVEVGRPTDDDIACMKLRARLIKTEMKYVTGPRQQYSDCPQMPAHIALDTCGTNNYVVPIVETDTASFAPANNNDNLLRDALADRFKLMLSMLCHGMRMTRAGRDKFPDQEVFMIGIHGSRLYIFRGEFPGRKTSLVYSNRFIHADGRIETVPRGGNTGTGTHYYTLITPAGKNRNSYPQPVCPNEPIREVRTFYVRGSREYDLWRKGDFQDAVKLLVALDLYLMSGEAKCGVLQRAFAERTLTETEDEREITDQEIEEAKEKAHAQMAMFQHEEDRIREDGRRGNGLREGNLKVLDANRLRYVTDRVNGIQRFRG